MIHFQYDGSEDVHRYVLAEVIPVREIDSITRRKVGEGMAENVVRNKYLKKI